MAEALNRSGQPALVAGPGVDRDGAWELIHQLAERTRATVWASPLSSRCGFSEDHPAFAGFLTPDRRQLADQLRRHDVVVVLGAPIFTYHVHSEGPIVAEGTELYQLVDDPNAAAFAPAGMTVLTTLRHGLVQLLDDVAPVAPAGRAAPLGRGELDARPAPAATDPISGAFVMQVVQCLMPDDAIVVEEAPSHRNLLHEYLPIRASGGFYAAASGGLGWALPAAVGVGLGSPGRRIVCLLGDGSSLYSIQALWTAARHRLPITFVIFNNRGYSALKALGKRIGLDEPPGVDLPALDLVAIAEGFGCEASRVEQAERLEPGLRAAFEADGPTLLDVLVDATVERLY